ncbi:MAG: alginate export family protein [Candidatus Competibacteraceae bacterium]
MAVAVAGSQANARYRFKLRKWLTPGLLLGLSLLTSPPPVRATDRLPFEEHNDESTDQAHQTDPADAAESSFEIEIAGEYWRQLSLGDEPDDGLRELGAEFTAALSYPLRPGLTFFGEVIGLLETQWTDTEPNRHTDESLERGELWLRWQPNLNSALALQFGSQTFSEPREWWWEEDLDALRLEYGNDAGVFTAALAKETAPRSTLDDDIHPADDDVVRALVHLRRTWDSAQQLDAFALYQRDRSDTPRLGEIANRNDEVDADLNWLGLRASGGLALENYGALSYRLDGAWVWGHERLVEFADSDGDFAEVTESRRLDVRGWALDVGGAWTLPVTAQPQLFLGYAVGSGDADPDDATDRSFRQTGLQENEDLFRYYGELFYPELSNLRIFTVGVNWPLLDDGLLSLVHHRYRQDQPAPFLRDVGIERDPEASIPI